MTGVLCGIAFMAAIWAGSTWWKLGRSAEDGDTYDHCLVQQHGNTVACDAMMRIFERSRAAEAMQAQAATLLAAGFSKREVVKWARDQGFNNLEISAAVGISPQDLHAGKY